MPLKNVTPIVDGVIEAIAISNSLKKIGLSIIINCEILHQ